MGRGAAQLTAPGTDTPWRRWRGQAGRLEVVYATVSDPGTGIGAWVHHELVAPVAAPAFNHGWAAVFRPPAEPVLERFGPGPVLDPPALRGQAGRLRWDVRWERPEAPAPLYTFPNWAWEREVLPAAQVVPVPSAAFTGRLELDGRQLELTSEARGAVGHVYGHGNAERWGWLHAELGGGDVLEVVAAVSRRPGLQKLPPMPFVQLRMGGRDWPRDALAAAPLLRARLELPRWDVSGTIGRWRLRAEVEIPASQSVTLGYVDPDGAGATCTNSEVADAEIVLERRRGGRSPERWETAAAWSLRGAAHAEIGTRP
jgi:hypothetical protein